MKRRVEVEINLDALVGNYRKIASRVRPARVLSVLKADAYGLGVGVYARALAAAGCRDFGVAEPFEALELKKVLAEEGVKASVQILGAVLPDEIPAMVRAGVVLPVTDIASASLVSAAAVSSSRKVRVHFKIDTGMGRLGIFAGQAVETMLAAAKLPGIVAEGVYSHFPVAYDVNDGFTLRQISVFKKVLAASAKAGLKFEKVHIAASDAINNFPQTALPPFTMVRTGINLHGSFDPQGAKALDLEPVLTLRTRVAQVRKLKRGSSVGYGRMWKAPSSRAIATICAGYADGLPLGLSAGGSVVIGGKICPLVGRISMDYATVDVTGVPGVKAGDEVVCLGSSSGYSITPDDWASLKGTHAYDIICSLGSRVLRTVKKGMENR